MAAIDEVTFNTYMQFLVDAGMSPEEARSKAYADLETSETEIVRGGAGSVPTTVPNGAPGGTAATARTATRAVPDGWTVVTRDPATGEPVEIAQRLENGETEIQRWNEGDDLTGTNRGWKYNRTQDRPPTPTQERPDYYPGTTNTTGSGGPGNPAAAGAENVSGDGSVWVKKNPDGSQVIWRYNGIINGEARYTTEYVAPKDAKKEEDKVTTKAEEIFNARASLGSAREGLAPGMGSTEEPAAGAPKLNDQGGYGQRTPGSNGNPLIGQNVYAYDLGGNATAVGHWMKTPGGGSMFVNPGMVNQVLATGGYIPTGDFETDAQTYNDMELDRFDYQYKHPKLTPAQIQQFYFDPIANARQSLRDDALRGALTGKPEPFLGEEDLYQADGGTNLAGAPGLEDPKNGFNTPNPVAIVDLATGQPKAIAGEDGAERIDVVPLQSPENRPSAKGGPRLNGDTISRNFKGVNYFMPSTGGNWVDETQFLMPSWNDYIDQLWGGVEYDPAHPNVVLQRRLFQDMVDKWQQRFGISGGGVDFTRQGPPMPWEGRSRGRTQLYQFNRDRGPRSIGIGAFADGGSIQVGGGMSLPQNWYDQSEITMMDDGGEITAGLPPFVEGPGGNYNDLLNRYNGLFNPNAQLDSSQVADRRGEDLRWTMPGYEQATMHRDMVDLIAKYLGGWGTNPAQPQVQLNSAHADARYGNPLGTRTPYEPIGQYEPMPEPQYFADGGSMITGASAPDTEPEYTPHKGAPSMPKGVTPDYDNAPSGWTWSDTFKQYQKVAINKDGIWEATGKFRDGPPPKGQSLAPDPLPGRGGEMQAAGFPDLMSSLVNRYQKKR